MTYPPQQSGQPHDPWQTTGHLPQPGWTGVPTAPKKKSNTGLIVGVVAAAVALVCGGAAVVVALAGDVGGHTIRFEVTTGGGTASLINWSTLEDSAIEKDVAASVEAPWSKEVRLEDQLGLVGVNATAADGRNVACKLIVDGKVVDEGESAGVVNCSDTVG